jgi:hypothetical protein
LKVFPDPCSRILHYSVTGRGGTPKEIELLDVAGRLVERLHVAGPTGVIDLSRMDAGIYFVRVRGAWGVSTRALKVD